MHLRYAMGINMKSVYQYCVLEVARESVQIEYPWLYRWLPGNMRTKKEEAFKLNKLPILKEDSAAFGETGIKITVPYTYGELERFSKEEIAYIFLRIIKREEVKNIVVNERLKKYIPEEYIQEEGVLFVLYLEEALTWSMRQHGISKKDAHIVILDNGKEGQLPFILEQLGEEMNHLTIVTDRSGYFIDYVDYMYGESGLIVTLAERPLMGPVDGNIIIDLEQKVTEEYKYYPEGCVVLQCFYRSKAIRDILAKRKDVHCYNRLYLKTAAGTIENKLLQAAICEETKQANVSQLKVMRERMKVNQIEIERLGVKV
jgi:hypothetical protein